MLTVRIQQHRPALARRAVASTDAGGVAGLRVPGLFEISLDPINGTHEVQHFAASVDHELVAACAAVGLKAGGRSPIVGTQNEAPGFARATISVEGDRDLRVGPFLAALQEGIAAADVESS